MSFILWLVAVVTILGLLWYYSDDEDKAGTAVGSFIVGLITYGVIQYASKMETKAWTVDLENCKRLGFELSNCVLTTADKELFWEQFYNPAFLVLVVAGIVCFVSICKLVISFFKT